MRRIAILGSTGSIGTQALSVIREHRESFDVVALSCGENIRLIAGQIKEFSPALVSVGTEKAAGELRELLEKDNIRTAEGAFPEITYGEEGLIKVSTSPEAGIVLTAIVGMLGIAPTVAAIKAGKDIALANKETLVCAGHIIMPLAKEYGVSILPVDSEHSAIFQSLQGNQGNRIEKILLTASGGPFRGKTFDELSDMGPEEALRNPNWKMGKKVTVDSATMANKGLEVIEAHYLFDVPIDDIEVVVHPESILHSAVQYSDGAVIGELSVPDMRLPIQYALFYPERPPLSVERLDLFSLSSLTFEKPDTKAFPALSLAMSAGKTGGNMPAVFNAADELAVSAFLGGRALFTDIPKLISGAMEAVSFIDSPTLSDIADTQRTVEDYFKEKNF